MRHQIEAQVLRIYVGEQDHYGTGLLYAEIVSNLKKLNISGVTVFHGVEGFGAHKLLHTMRFEDLFVGLPVVIEAIDIPDRIEAAAAAMNEMIVEGLVTVQDVTAIRYIKDPKLEDKGVA
jgi:hypothetical protein